MDRVIEIIKNSLSERGVDNRYEPETGFLRFLAFEKDQDFRVVAVYATGFLSIRIYFPMRFGRTRRRQASEFVNRASWPMRYGSFYFDEDTGRMAFSVYAPVNGETVEPETLAEMFHLLMSLAMFRVACAFDAVTKLSHGRIKAAQALTMMDAQRKKADEEPRIPVELLDAHAIAVN